MRQQLLDKASTSSVRTGSSRRRRRERAALKANLERNSAKPSRQATARPQPSGAISPMRKFMLSLMFLAPMGALGTLCFALVQNNLKLHQKNDKLTGIANEVRAEIDTLSEEIETLRQRAGVAEEAAEVSAEGGFTRDEGTTSSRPVESNEGQRPQGGLAKEIDALDLLEDARAQVPKLNKALDSAAQPLEATLAAEAAYPTGIPMTGYLDISSEFGVRSNPFSGGGYEVHEGMDFIGDIGDIVATTGEGTVTMAGPNGGYGNTVTVDHGYGYETLYAHLSSVRVEVGDRVKRGQIVGHVGSTGRSSGPHLHYSIYKDKKAMDPRKLMKVPENILAFEPR